MTDETRAASPWLPNLVGGISIWKLARDLNEPKFFDGSLLVPETEGTDALPTTVRWDVSGLLPMPEARAKAPAELDAAVADFLARLKRVAAEMADESSGYHKYKDAFTVPGLDADGGAYYFYEERTKKLRLINWGASPRSIAGQQEIVFGWDAFGKLIETAGQKAEASPTTGAALPAQAALTTKETPPPAKAPEPEDKKKENKEEEARKKAASGRPLWHWLLVALVVALLLALLVFLLRNCGEVTEVTYPEAGATGDAQTRASTAPGPSSAADAAAGHARDGGTDAGPDASKDAAGDAHGDARSDGGGPPASPASPSAAGSGGAGGVSIGNILLVPGKGGDSALPRRAHFEPHATHWRVISGQEQLDPSSPLQGDGQEFQVVLKASGSFDKVKVQWQDPIGRWHE